MPDDPMADALLGLGREAKDPHVKVRSAALVAGVPIDVADDFLSVTGGIESGNAHFDQRGRVKLSPVDPKDGQRAVGFSQIKPATARSVGVTEPYDEMQNIIAGVRYFNQGGNDPVRRRIAYFGGTKSKAVASYDRTGRIPSGQDQTGTTFSKYVKATMPGGQDVETQRSIKGRRASAPTGDDPMAEALNELSNGQQSNAPSPSKTPTPPLSTNDTQWHFGEYIPKPTRRALEVLRDAVAQDERKKAAGQTIAPPPLEYQNQMRAKAGLAPLPVPTNPYDMNQILSDARGRAQALTFDDDRQERIRRQPSTSVGALKQSDEKVVQRLQRLRQQVETDTAVGGDFLSSRPHVSNPSLDTGDEVMRRYHDEVEQEKEDARQAAQYEKDKPEIDRLAAKYRTALKLSGGAYGTGGQNKWAAETLLKGGSGLTELLSGILRFAPSDSEEMGNAVNIHAQAMQQAAMEEGMDRNAASKFTQDILGGFISSAPELAAMGIGIPAPVVFGAGSGMRAHGAQRPIVPAVAHGAATGAAFEIPVEGALARAGTVGAATTVTNLAAGQPFGEAVKSGAVNALMAGIGGRRNEPAAQPEGQRFYHRDWGEVVRAEDQTGARPGQTKVYEANNPDQFHYPRTADLSGRGNQRMVPVRPSKTGEGQPTITLRPRNASSSPIDPMDEALTSLGAKIHRTPEPDAGPAQFRGLDDSGVHDLMTRPIPKGTSRSKRQQIAEEQAAARVELQRRSGETPIEILPPDTGLRADRGDVPSFRDYVENRPAGGIKFETLEPGSPDLNQLAREYTVRYGTRAQSAPLMGRSRVASIRQGRAGAERQILKNRASSSADILTETPKVDPMADALTEIAQPATARPINAERNIEPTPLKMAGQKIAVAGLKDAEVIDAQRLDGVDYELYKAGKSGVTRIYDADSGQVVGITKHPTFAAAAKSHSEALEASGGNVDAWRDAAPASAVKEVPIKAKAAEKELLPVRSLSVGRESKAVTERGSEINTRYAIVDLEDLITSHDSTLNVNPKFPQELQPRERDRAASADQISRIASKLRPDFLGESPKASEGAPIVGHDGIVESGNGRVLGIRQAYEAKNDGSRAYKTYLRDNAERLGLDPQAVTDAKQPVLVRIRTSEVDRPQFVKEANEQSIASMSPVEQARSDAKMLKGTLLDLFRPSESGDINTAANMNFVRAFMKDVIGPNEVGRYTTASGQLSQEGVARIRNGIFARAYGDSPEGLIALEKLAESPDNNVRNITTAMLRNAPGFASLKEGIDQGTRYPLDLAPDISAAMSKMSSLRENGMLVPDYLKQGALYGEDLTPIQKRLLQVFDENKRGANTIDAILKNYLRGADAAGSPHQGGLFGTETPSKADFLEAAILEAIDAHKDVSPGLFAATDQGLQSQPATRGANPQVNARISEIGTASAPPDLPATFAPRLTESTPESATTEAAGHSLKRFDSTIDRLKAQEEEARQRLAERRTEFQKLLDQKGSELGGTTIPQDLYDYVVIGASKLAQRSLNAAQFVDEMVREFGEAIRKHARTIFTLSRKMVSETQKEIRNERLSKEIADRLFTDNVPKDQQREALKIAARFRTSTDTQGKFLSGFKSRVGEMAKSYGAAGGELTNRVHLGDIARGHEMEAGNKYLSRIQDVYSKVKNDFERQRISDAVINALENRAEADRYLDTPQKQAVYKDTKEMLDTFRKKLTALGYETREDYFTHIRDVDILDQIISDAKDPKDVNLNDLVAAKSRFLQTRVDAKMEIKKDLPRVLFAYLKSVTKEIAYSDAVQYYYDHFPTDIPISLRKNSMDRAIKLMQNSLKPEQGRGTFYRVAGKLRSEQYRNFLAYNLKAAAQNFTQVDFARMRWTPEARNISGKMWRNRRALTGPLADAIDLASTEQTPLMRFLEQFKGDEPSGSRGRLAEAFNKYDPFQRSEKRNWALSELGSIVNSVVKRPEYKALKTQLGPEGAINKLLEKQEVFDSAVREAATTAAETQVAANPAMRGEFYDAPLHRIIGMFTAFKTRQLQILSEALRKHEGINGARAQTILRRGLTGDAQPVEVLREIEAQRTAMEKMVSRANKFNENVGIPRGSLVEMINHLKAQENQLNGIIKRIEPLSGGRARSAVLVAKYFAKVSAISVFFNLFWNSVYSAVAGPEKKDEDAEGQVSIALQKAFWDVLPTPFYGADPSKFLVSPIAPNFERSAAFGHITKRGVVRDVVSYGSSVIPFAGVVDRATNRWASGKVVDLVAPKKEKEQKIKF